MPKTSTGQLPSSDQGAVGDVLGHCAYCMEGSPEQAAMRERLLGARAALRALHYTLLDTERVRALITNLGVSAKLIVHLVETQSSPYKGEAWDAQWARVIAQLKVLAARRAS